MKFSCRTVFALLNGLRLRQRVCRFSVSGLRGCVCSVSPII